MGLRRALTCGCYALAGCAQLSGIQQTTGADAGTSAGVSLTFDRLSIGATVVRAPQPLDPPLAASFLVVDGSDPSVVHPIAAIQSATNTWSAPISDGAPAVSFTLPDYPTPISRQWSFGRTMIGLFGQMEHPDRTAAPMGATVHAKVSLPAPYAATDAFQIYVVGTWAVHGLPAGELPAVGGTAIDATIGYDTTRFAAITGRPLDKIAAADALLVLRYTGNDLTGSFAAPAFDQTGADTVSGALVANPHDKALDIHFQPAMPGQRFAATRPAVAGVQMGWDLHAAPGYLYANNNGPTLAGAAILPADPGTLTTPYGNPFTARGWNTIFNWNNYETRTVTVPGPNLPVTLYAGLQELAEPAPGLALDLPAGLPLLVSLNGTPLSTDLVTVSIDQSKAIDIDFVADRMTNTFYVAQVLELVPNLPTGATALVYALRYSASGLATKFKLPAGVLQSGHTYTIRAICVAGGYSAAATGDLTQRGLPFTQGYLDSGVFTVAP